MGLTISDTVDFQLNSNRCTLMLLLTFNRKCIKLKFIRLWNKISVFIDKDVHVLWYLIHSTKIPIGCHVRTALSRTFVQFTEFFFNEFRTQRSRTNKNLIFSPFWERSGVPEFLTAVAIVSNLIRRRKETENMCQAFAMRLTMRYTKLPSYFLQSARWIYPRESGRSRTCANDSW